MSKLGFHEPFGYPQHKLWQKERSGIKLTIWLLITKSQKSTRFPCVQVMCDISLKSSRWGLQRFFRPHRDWRFSQEVMRPQSCESPNSWNFWTPTWESRDKKPFGCGPCGELQSILYGGRWWLPSSLGHDESCEFRVR
jgi:hypothetical protein